MNKQQIFALKLEAERAWISYIRKVLEQYEISLLFSKEGDKLPERPYISGRQVGSSEGKFRTETSAAEG